jgi:hypothetical protein
LNRFQTGVVDESAAETVTELSDVDVTGDAARDAAKPRNVAVASATQRTITLQWECDAVDVASFLITYEKTPAEPLEAVLELGPQTSDPEYSFELRELGNGGGTSQRHSG